MSATLKNIDKSNQIGVHVGMRILKGISDPGLGREVDDHIETITVKQFFQAVAIGQIQSCKDEIRV